MPTQTLPARFALIGFLACLFLVAVSPSAFAIPAFSRQYSTSCSTCHVNFPKLNDFGKAFKDAGFKFPKDDEAMIKIPPTMLGAPANVELWPHTIWPGTIPGMPPIGLRYNSFFQVTSANRGRINNAITPPGTVPPFIPRTDFQSGLFSIFMAGNFGSDIAFWVDDDLSVAGSGADGGLGDGYLKFVNVGRFLKLPKDVLSLRVGQFELDLPFSQARSHNLSGWDIYDQANIGVMNGLASFQQQFVNNGFAFSGAAKGVEFSGGHQYGGYHYSIAVMNQTTGGQPIDTGAFVSSATGFQSDANFKDLYGRFSYRFNLERDKDSRNSVQAAGPMGPRDHTYITLGTYYLYGRSVQRLAAVDPVTGASLMATAREPFYRVGADFSFNYRNFNLYGLYMYGHDHNLLPVDATGAVVPLPYPQPFVTGTPIVNGFVRGVPATFSGGFLQADYLAMPWMMLIMRYDGVNSTADRINSIGVAGPFASTRNRVTPGVQFLIHANIKASFEYQIRPQQTVTFVTNPVTGVPTGANPFRTNTAVAGLEFVY